MAAYEVFDLPADDPIMWTGRTATPGFLVEHVREEMALHRWDMTGDDAMAVGFDAH